MCERNVMCMDNSEALSNPSNNKAVLKYRYLNFSQ